MFFVVPPPLTTCNFFSKKLIYNLTRYEWKKCVFVPHLPPNSPYPFSGCNIVIFLVKNQIPLSRSLRQDKKITQFLDIPPPPQPTPFSLYSFSKSENTLVKVLLVGQEQKISAPGLFFCLRYLCHTPFPPIFHSLLNHNFPFVFPLLKYNIKATKVQWLLVLFNAMGSFSS